MSEYQRTEIEVPVIDGLLLCGLLEDVVAGRDINSYVEEAGVVLRGLQGQLSDLRIGDEL